MLYKSSKNIIAILTIIVFALAGCGDDSSNSASLDGDLSFEIRGDTDVTFNVTKTEVNGNNISSESIASFVTPPIEQDLEDGDYDGYVLQAFPTGGEEADITLMLLSDGDVVKETSSINGDFGSYRIVVGDVPDPDDFEDLF